VALAKGLTFGDFGEARDATEPEVFNPSPGDWKT